MRIAWDQAGERRYETGIDRGVLYRPDGVAVPWNGLTSIDEKAGRELSPIYLDGIRIRNKQIQDAYAATLSAFTYPDDLDGLVGTVQAAPGVRLHDQRATPFHLSYRTRIGNDLEEEHGYKIHVVYSVMATPSDSTIQTTSDDPEATEFSWDLNGLPSRLTGHRPTCHISFDSRLISGGALTAVEAALYGTSGANANLPSLQDLLTLAGG